MAKTTNTEVLQPHMLVEVKHSPNKPLEEPNKKPVTFKVHPITQEPHQMSSLDINNLKPLSALPPLIDLAPTSTIECATTYDVPYHKAINTSTWARLAMHLDTTFPDANSSMAIDWHATLGHMSLINNSAICWPSKW
jgi:hypothetical protein